MQITDRGIKAYGLIGLAAKKGSVVSGWSACESELRKIPKARQSGKGKRFLVLLAGDSANNTKEKFMKLSMDRGVDYIVFGSCSELGRHIGKGERSILIVTDEGLARGIHELLRFVADENGGV